MIANKVRSAGLAHILGATSLQNVHEEPQQKLDVRAHVILSKAVVDGGSLGGMASDEGPGIDRTPTGCRCGEYYALCDPLGGPFNVDVIVLGGTLSSGRKNSPRGSRGQLENILQPGRG